MIFQDALKRNAKSFSEFVHKKFGHDSGQMLLITGAIGIGLSSGAQSAAIFFNDKYSISQKAFMIPQELAEGAVTIASLFLITTPLQIFAKKYAKTGKILTKDLNDYMKKHNLLQKRGNPDFDLPTNIKRIMSDAEKSDKFIKSSDKAKKTILAEHENILQKYNANLDATTSIAATAGGILSTTLIAPFFRNYTASYFQKINMNAYNNLPQQYKRKSTEIHPKTYNYTHHSGALSV